MKKKWLIAIAAVLVVTAFTLIACSSPSAGETTAESTMPAEEGQPTEEEHAEEPAVEEPSYGEPESGGSLTDGTLTEDTITENPAEGNEITGNLQENASVSEAVRGEVQEIIRNENSSVQVHVTGQNESNPANDILANITEETILIDAQTGEAVDLESITVGDEVQVYVSSAMTRSLPPQSNAYAIITNIPETGLGVPTFLIAEEVQHQEDGSITVLNENKDLYVTIPADVEISVFDQDGASVAGEEVAEGNALFAWFDVVAESYPAQATATSAMIVK
ncbi:hypothetical protein LJC56_03645 [Christensenellaceae bacterium OttesenSCG-928-K19]|nr:hypothetical protein [Christensenellaceae bacterium OttesenSCG-928-K19]